MNISKYTYFIRRRYYRLQLFWRFMKYPYWGPWEIVNPIMETVFEIFCEYYEKCGIAKKEKLEICEDDHFPGQTEYQNKMLDEQKRLYKWWTQDYKKRQEEIDTLEEEWSNHSVHWTEPYEDNLFLWESKSTRYGRYLFKLLHTEEEKFEQEKEDALVSLMKIRNTLWE